MLGRIQFILVAIGAIFFAALAALTRHNRAIRAQVTSQVALADSKAAIETAKKAKQVRKDHANEMAKLDRDGLISERDRLRQHK